MAALQADILNKLGIIQQQIWHTVTQTVGATLEDSLVFEAPVSEVASFEACQADIGGPMLTVQFAFASSPESVQLILIPRETIQCWIGLVKGEEAVEVDEGAVSELRGQFEAIVQGLCQAVGAVRGETMVASGLSIRYHVPSFPANLANGDLLRTRVAAATESFRGETIWLMDAETAETIVNAESESDGVGGFESAALPSGARDVEPSGLELLMDIPLEISVELGRVKMLVKDVVDLGTGSIVEIEKAAGEPVDVMVNGRLVARGEVVVIEDNFGVRITEILNPHERLMKLGDAA